MPSAANKPRVVMVRVAMRRVRWLCCSMARKLRAATRVNLPAQLLVAGARGGSARGRAQVPAEPGGHRIGQGNITEPGR